MVQLCAYHILLDNGSSPSAKVVHPFIVEKCHHWCSFHSATITINNQLISIRVLHPFVIYWCDFQSLAITINCANKSKNSLPYVCVCISLLNIFPKILQVSWMKAKIALQDSDWQESFQGAHLILPRYLARFDQDITLPRNMAKSCQN